LSIPPPLPPWTPAPHVLLHVLHRVTPCQHPLTVVPRHYYYCELPFPLLLAPHRRLFSLVVVVVLGVVCAARPSGVQLQGGTAGGSMVGDTGGCGHPSDAHAALQPARPGLRPRQPRQGRPLPGVRGDPPKVRGGGGGGYRNGAFIVNVFWRRFLLLGMTRAIRKIDTGRGGIACFAHRLLTWFAFHRFLFAAWCLPPVRPAWFCRTWPDEQTDWG